MAEKTVPVLAEGKPKGVWMECLLIVAIISGVVGYGLAASSKSNTSNVVNTKRQKPVASTVDRINYKASWSCTSPESVKDLEVVKGNWTFVPEKGPNGLGCMETSLDRTKIILKIPRASAPYRVTFQSRPDPQSTTGIYWNNFYGWGVGAFHNLAKPALKGGTGWFLHTYYVSLTHMDYFTDGKRTSFMFSSMSDNNELVLCIDGRCRISNITVESIEESEMPDYSQLQKALDRIPLEKRVGRINTPEISACDPVRPVYITFSGPVKLDDWLEATPQP